MQIKYFKSDLVPMEIPVFEGVETLDTIGDDSYPLYARPHIDGVTAMIRHGHFHFTHGEDRLSNLSIKQQFSNLLDFARVNHYSMHCTFKSDSVEDSVLQQMLTKIDTITLEEAQATSEDGCGLYHGSDVLPGDLKLYITDMIIDSCAEKMTIGSRAVSLDFLNREFGMNGIEVLVPEYCVDNDHLDIQLEDFRRSGSLGDGVVLYSDGSVYMQGDSNRSTGAVVIRLSEEVELQVLIQSHISKFIMKRSSDSGTFIVADENGSVHPVHLSTLSDKAYDSFMSGSDSSVGAKIHAKRVRLRTHQIPTNYEIKTFRYAS